MKREPAALEEAARRLTAALGDGECVLIGGLAVAAYGYARATSDVDLMSRVPLEEARRRLSRAGVKSVLRRGDVESGGFDCLRGELLGVGFDILPALVPVDWAQAIAVALPGGGSLRVVDLRTLIHLKLRAGGPMDVLDVVMLIRLHPDEMAPARERAAAYGLVSQLESFANNERIKAKAKEAAGRRRPRPTSRSRF